MTDSEGNEIGKLFIGGLSQATNNASLRVYFSRFGEVDDAVVMMDNKTGRSRGFGYVKYREPESVMLALEAKPHVLDGKEVDAKQCNINMKGRNRRSLKIFVGGIGLDQDAESIKNFFRQFGRVTDVNLMMDSNKQRHRGFAFVGFEDESVVKRLINLHYVMMNTKQVEIKAMEPPNFGRKIGLNGCLTAAAVMNSTNPPEATCGHTFEGGPECGNILSASFINPISYIPTQSTGIPCLAPSMLTRPNPTGLYDQSTGAYNASLESLYQPTTFIQPFSHSNKVADAISTQGPYMGTRQSIPFVVTNGQYQTTAINQNATPMYTAFPYQFISPTYISSAQQSVMSGVNQLVAANKSTPTWNSTALQAGSLAICPSHTPTMNSLFSCPTYTPTQTTTVQNSQQTDMTGGVTPLLTTPYYTLCPQYTAIPLQSEQPIASSYTIPNPSLNGTSIPQCTVQPNGTTDTTVNGSRSSSPVSETKQEQSKASKLAYPTIVMASPGSVQNTAVVAPPNHAMGQTLWNQSQSNLVYPPLQVGWAVHTNPQSGIQQTWLPPTGMAHQLTSNGGIDGTSAKSTSESTQQKVQENEVKQPGVESSSSTKTQAAGDGLDNLVASTKECNSTEFNCNGKVKSVIATSYSKTTNEAASKTNLVQATMESRRWQTTDTMLSPPSWSNSSAKWVEENQTQCNFSAPSKVHMQPWKTTRLSEDQINEQAGDFSYKQVLPQSNLTSNIRETTVTYKLDRNTIDPLCHRVTQVKQVGPNPPHTRQQPSPFQPGRVGNNNQTSIGENISAEIRTSRSHREACGTDTYTDYSAWLPHKPVTEAGHVDKSIGDRKELQVTSSIELECQGPAGAAGDFHRPMHTAHYSGFRVAR